ncbi:unnamed protein product, partial [Amoebophrya sp. A25]|eukprot:GSA25T00019232001.1
MKLLFTRPRASAQASGSFFSSGRSGASSSSTTSLADTGFVTSSAHSTTRASPASNLGKVGEDKFKQRKRHGSSQELHRQLHSPCAACSPRPAAIRLETKHQDVQHGQHLSDRTRRTDRGKEKSRCRRMRCVRHRLRLGASSFLVHTTTSTILFLLSTCSGRSGFTRSVDDDLRDIFFFTETGTEERHRYQELDRREHQKDDRPLVLEQNQVLHSERQRDWNNYNRVGEHEQAGGFFYNHLVNERTSRHDLEADEVQQGAERNAQGQRRQQAGQGQELCGDGAASASGQEHHRQQYCIGHGIPSQFRCGETQFQGLQGQQLYGVEAHQLQRQGEGQGQQCGGGAASSSSTIQHQEEHSSRIQHEVEWRLRDHRSERGGDHGLDQNLTHEQEDRQPSGSGQPADGSGCASSSLSPLRRVWGRGTNFRESLRSKDRLPAGTPTKRGQQTLSCCSADSQNHEEQVNLQVGDQQQEIASTNEISSAPVPTADVVMSHHFPNYAGGGSQNQTLPSPIASTMVASAELYHADTSASGTTFLQEPPPGGLPYTSGTGAASSSSGQFLPPAASSASTQPTTGRSLEPTIGLQRPEEPRIVRAPPGLTVDADSTTRNPGAGGASSEKPQYQYQSVIFVNERGQRVVPLPCSSAFCTNNVTSDGGCQTQAASPASSSPIMMNHNQGCSTTPGLCSATSGGQAYAPRLNQRTRIFTPTPPLPPGLFPQSQASTTRPEDPTPTPTTTCTSFTVPHSPNYPTSTACRGRVALGLAPEPQSRPPSPSTSSSKMAQTQHQNQREIINVSSQAAQPPSRPPGNFHVSQRHVETRFLNCSSMQTFRTVHRDARTTPIDAQSRFANICPGLRDQLRVHSSSLDLLDALNLEASPGFLERHNAKEAQGVATAACCHEVCARSMWITEQDCASPAEEMEDDQNPYDMVPCEGRSGIPSRACIFIPQHRTRSTATAGAVGGRGVQKRSCQQIDEQQRSKNGHDDCRGTSEPQSAPQLLHFDYINAANLQPRKKRRVQHAEAEPEVEPDVDELEEHEQGHVKHEHEVETEVHRYRDGAGNVDAQLQQDSHFSACSRTMDKHDHEHDLDLVRRVQRRQEDAADDDPLQDFSVQSGLLRDETEREGDEELASKEDVHADVETVHAAQEDAVDRREGAAGARISLPPTTNIKKKKKKNIITILLPPSRGHATRLLDSLGLELTPARGPINKGERRLLHGI